MCMYLYLCECVACNMPMCLFAWNYGLQCAYICIWLNAWLVMCIYMRFDDCVACNVHVDVYRWTHNVYCACRCVWMSAWLVMCMYMCLNECIMYNVHASCRVWRPCNCMWAPKKEIHQPARCAHMTYRPRLSSTSTHSLVIVCLKHPDKSMLRFRQKFADATSCCYVMACLGCNLQGRHAWHIRLNIACMQCDLALHGMSGVPSANQSCMTHLTDHRNTRQISWQLSLPSSVLLLEVTLLWKCFCSYQSLSRCNIRLYRWTHLWVLKLGVARSAS